MGKADVQVRRVSTEVLLISASRQELDVTTAAAEVLLVLDGELQNESLTFVGEGLEGRRDLVEAVILSGLKTLVVLSIAEETAGTVIPATKVILVLGDNPLASVGVLSKVSDDSGGEKQKRQRKNK